jgi:hypothetical protein
MFPALTCPSSEGMIVFTQHLVSSLSVNVCTVHWLRALNILYYDARSIRHQKTHFVSNNFFSKNRAVYEIMWKNIIELDRPQMTV